MWYQINYASLDNDQLNTILIATIIASTKRSGTVGINIILLVTLPTSRSSARINSFSLMLNVLLFLCLL
jgi:hypothetical protein